jgi:hypothetical protein
MTHPEQPLRHRSAMTLRFLWITAGLSSSFVHGVHAFSIYPLARQVTVASRADNAQLLRLHASQVLEFIEPETGVRVKLVGSMHYNPTSIRLATDTIQELAEVNQLGSVIIESCDIRYESSKGQNPMLKKLLRSEMAAACHVALTYNRPVVLGDQRINITVANMKSAFAETMLDLVQPFQGGWNRIASNVTQAWSDAAAAPNEPPYLTPWSFLDPQLLLAAPVSLVKYPLSYFNKSPVLFLALVFTLGFLVDVSNYNSDAAVAAALSNRDDGWTWGLVATEVTSLGIAALETVVFTRVILKEILHERNVILADSILRQCRLYQRSNAVNGAWRLSLFPSMLSPSSSANALVEDDIMYVKPNCDDGENVETMTVSSSDRSDKTIVAVVGMAHCNGIKKLLHDRER